MRPCCEHPLTKRVLVVERLEMDKWISIQAQCIDHVTNNTIQNSLLSACSDDRLQTSPNDRSLPFGEQLSTEPVLNK